MFPPGLLTFLAVLLSLSASVTALVSQLEPQGNSSQTAAGNDKEFSKAGAGSGRCGQNSDKIPVCKSSEKCIGKDKVCDGVKDCPDGEDEARALCSVTPCLRDHIRCETDHVCLPPGAASLCSDGDPRCPDKSDQSYCLHKVYTGCFANTSLGLKIVDCGSCFCELRNTSAGPRAGLEHVSRRGQGRAVTAKICMERTQSNLFCDGVEDCLFGEDEDGELCYKVDDPFAKVQTANVEPEEDKEEAEDGVRVDTVNREVGQLGDLVDLAIIVVIFFISCVTVVGVCVIVILAGYKLVRTRKKAGLGQLLSPGSHHQGSLSSFQDFIPGHLAPQSSAQAPRRPQWSLRTTSIVKELGQGFYSKVYLAQDTKGVFVALKTVDIQKTSGAEECISNEIDILTTVGSHLNIVKLLGYNREEKLIVMEYCFNGNLRDYISRYRDYFLDEVHPITGELREEATFYRSPTDSDTFPMSDFLSSMHADIDCPEGSLKRRTEPGPKHGKSLIKTRRLLYWSYQVAKGMKYLADLGIIHRDVALRNMLLTNNDVVKIADFGLAVSIFGTPGTVMPSPGAGNTLPQYWSRSNKPQPYRWMALESLSANVFSQSSDAWSLGVTLWEMFTLGSEPWDSLSPLELSQTLQSGKRLDAARFAPAQVRHIMTGCWAADPSLRPGFDSLVIQLGGYMSRTDRQSYDARSRLDSGLGMVDSSTVSEGGQQSQHNVSTPSTGTTSKSSTRSRTISKCSELSWLPSSSSSQVPSPKVSRANYWANYKGMTNSESQVYSSVGGDRAGQRARSQYAVPQTSSNSDRQFSTLDTYLKNKNLY